MENIGTKAKNWKEYWAAHNEALVLEERDKKGKHIRYYHGAVDALIAQLSEADKEMWETKYAMAKAATPDFDAQVK